MYNINRKQYIFKMPSGQCLNIYYRPYTGICYSRQTSGSAWTSPVVILKDSLPGFSACLDTADNIHILCQDQKSNILYINFKDDICSYKPISKNKSDEPCDKSPYICCHGDDLHFFYIIENLGKKLLYYQAYTNGSLSVPRAIDYIKKTVRTYSVTNNTGGHIGVFYMKPAGKYDIPGYRIFDILEKNWSDFTAINKDTGLSDEQILSVSSDKNGYMHLCLQKAYENKYELKYMKIREGEESDSYLTTLTSSPYSFINSSLFSTGHKLIVYWVREDNIFYCASADNGNTWSKPDKYPYIEDQSFCCTRFFSNIPGDNRNIKDIDIPANISDGFRPAFINDSANGKEGAEDMEDFKSYALSALKVISTNIEEINRIIRETDETVKALETRQQQLDETSGRLVSAANHTSEEMIKVCAEIDDLRAEFLDMKEKQKDDPKDMVKDAEAIIKAETEESISISSNEAAAVTGKKHFSGTSPIIVGTGFAQITYDYLKNSS